MIDRYTWVLVMGCVLIGTFCPAAAVSWPEPSDGYYLYLGNIPDVGGGITSTYTEQLQGVAHDDANWYFTQRETLWKVPLGHRLSSVTGSDPDVLHRQIDYYNLLDGYNHFGDPECYRHAGEWYLVVPLEGKDPPVIAVFRSNLSLVGIAGLTEQDGHASWCAVGSDGEIYSSSWIVNHYRRYNLSWDALGTTNTLTPLGTIPFYDESGSSMTIQHIQGGVLSPDGRRLYISAGYNEGHSDPEGIMVFDTDSGRMIARSTNGNGVFNFKFDPSLTKREEPEGLTIWDIDDKSPEETGGVTGQLHVCLLDDDWDDQDSLFFKHYSNTLTVDSSYTIGGSDGTPDSPYTVITDALAVINDLSWDGARLKIRAGSYPETSLGAISIDKQIQVFSEGGTARIRDRITLHQGGTINIGNDGVLRIL